jgi:hypothetical protein
MLITGRSSDFAHFTEPSHFFFLRLQRIKQWQRIPKNFFKELTAAGTVKDFHLIPF